MKIVMYISIKIRMIIVPTNFAIVEMFYRVPLNKNLANMKLKVNRKSVYK